MDEFSDEGFSAYKGNRGPGLASARQKAASIAPAVLVVQHSDRLARGAGDAPGAAEHLAEIVFWARRHNVELHSCQDDFAFTHPLLAFAMGERNMEDSRRKALSVKAGMERAVRTGKAHGGPRPYGYRYSGDKNNTGQLMVVPDETEIVRRIFREFVAGRSLSAIARGLHEDGVKPMRGRLWRVSTISGVLTNPYYLGRIPFDGQVYDGHHEALVDQKTYEQAQAVFASRPSRGRGRPPKGNHLFRGGVLRCGVLRRGDGAPDQRRLSDVLLQRALQARQKVLLHPACPAGGHRLGRLCLL